MSANRNIEDSPPNHPPPPPNEDNVGDNGDNGDGNGEGGGGGGDPSQDAEADQETQEQLNREYMERSLIEYLFIQNFRLFRYWLVVNEFRAELNLIGGGERLFFRLRRLLMEASETLNGYAQQFAQSMRTHRGRVRIRLELPDVVPPFRPAFYFRLMRVREVGSVLPPHNSGPSRRPPPPPPSRDN